MLKGILDGVLKNNDDLEKIMQVVEAIWEDRDKIGEAVNLVWGNRERLLQVLDYVQDNQEMLTSVLDFVRDQREHIMNLVEQLPDLLQQTGGTIEAAGQSAMRAASFLTGADGDPDSLSARDLAEIVAKVLESCQDEIHTAAAMMQHFSKEVDGLTIPSVEPQFTEVMGFNVITGLEIGENALVEDAGERLRRGSTRLTDMGKQFDTFADQMRKLGKALTAAGDNLNQVGAQLATSGDTLRSLAGGPSKASVKAPAKDAKSGFSGLKTAKGKRKK